MPSVAGTAQTNAGMSKEAKQASQKAAELSDATADGDHESHGRAATAHYDAAWANERAGNVTKALDHRKQANVHGEKADLGRQAKSFADDMSRKATDLSTMAGKAKFGQDPSDPRSEKELHSDAAQAHEMAARAHELAGCDRGAKFHKAMAEQHGAAAEPPKDAPV